MLIKFIADDILIFLNLNRGDITRDHDIMYCMKLYNNIQILIRCVLNHRAVISEVK